MIAWDVFTVAVRGDTAVWDMAGGLGSRPAADVDRSHQNASPLMRPARVLMKTGARDGPRSGWYGYPG